MSIARRPGLGSTWWSSWFNLLTRLDWYIFATGVFAQLKWSDLSPFQDSLPGLGLEACQARPPDLETAVAVLEAHGDQVRPIFIKKIFPTRISFNIPNKVELAPVLASLPASTSLHRLAGFLTGSLEARLASNLDFSCDFFVTKALHREI